MCIISTFLYDSVMANPRIAALESIKAYVGKWYKWGGNNPLEGFDCSGLAIEYLKSAGILPRRIDMTANQLWQAFKHKQISKPKTGALVFWGNKTKIIHVEICINKHQSIGASGGGRNTLTIEDAIKNNAFVKVRFLNSRPNIAGYVDPFKKVKGE